MKKTILIFLMSTAFLFASAPLTEKEKIDIEKTKIEIEEKKIQIEKDKLELEKEKLELKKEKLEAEMDLMKTLKKKRAMLKELTPAVVFGKPVRNKTITISSRKITMPEVIEDKHGNFIADQISYYNRQNRKPIFLVMDYCYGGLVSEGEIILTAVKSSKAPVYVIVKNMAASMCAIIAGHAKYSYTLPNAMILHHQLSGGQRGPTAYQIHAVALMMEWEKRLLTPIAKKMGTSYRKFIQAMYKRAPGGDWIAFGNTAVKFGWVSGIITRIVDLSVEELENDEPTKPSILSLFGKKKNNRPFSFYWIYLKK